MGKEPLIERATELRSRGAGEALDDVEEALSVCWSAHNLLLVRVHKPRPCVFPPLRGVGHVMTTAARRQGDREGQLELVLITCV